MAQTGGGYTIINGQPVTAAALATGLRTGTIVENSSGPTRYSWATPSSPTPVQPPPGWTPPYIGLDPAAGGPPPVGVASPSDLLAWGARLGDLQTWAAPIARNFDFRFYEPTAPATRGELADNALWSANMSLEAPRTSRVFSGGGLRLTARAMTGLRLAGGYRAPTTRRAFKWRISAR